MKWEFDCINNSQTFVVPKSGVYKLEVWGAEGGTHYSIGVGSSGDFPTYHGIGIGGYGGYSVGAYYADRGTKLYVYVGGRGWDERKYDSSSPSKGGWNGGGADPVSWKKQSFKSTGGGATDISLIYSEVEEDSSHRFYRSNESYGARIIVAGGGGGGCQQNQEVGLGRGGSGGGYIGGTGQEGHKINRYGKGGTQSKPGDVMYDGASFGEFGIGSGNGAEKDGSCGGGGWWGGNQGVDGGAGGGSGYIEKVFSTSQISKGMWCYNCDESSNFQTKTTSVQTYSNIPLPFTPKEGDGYAIITLLYEISSAWRYGKLSLSFSFIMITVVLIK